jgi:tetratricopeptide (TPR) repeat protein
MTNIEESSVDTSTVLLEEYCGYGIANKPVDQDEKLRQVQAHISWENEEVALAIVNEMLAEDPKNQNLLTYKAYLLCMTDQDSEAMVLCDQLLKETNNKGVSSEEYQIPQGFIQAVKASILLEKENFKQALQLVNQAIEQESHPFYFVFRVMINLELDNTSQIIQDTTFAIENFKGYSIFISDQNEIDEMLADMYAIRAYAKQMQGQPWESDYQEALNRGSELVEDLF